MPCSLIINGEYLDIDGFLKISDLENFVKRYKGEPVVNSKPGGRKLERSTLRIETSPADFDDLSRQIADTIEYLKKNKEKLALINNTKEIELAVLDFGIALRIDNKLQMQSDKFPNELVKLAGEVGLDIELSIYPVGSDVKTKK